MGDPLPLFDPTNKIFLTFVKKTLGMCKNNSKLLKNIIMIYIENTLENNVW